MVRAGIVLVRVPCLKYMASYADEILLEQEKWQ